LQLVFGDDALFMIKMARGFVGGAAKSRNVFALQATSSGRSERNRRRYFLRD